jgi:hypothetical protein
MRICTIHTKILECRIGRLLDLEMVILNLHLSVQSILALHSSVKRPDIVPVANV